MGMHAQARGSTCTPQAEEEDQAQEEWEPRHGWTDFDPQATMVLHLGKEDSPTPWRLTPQQLRTMVQAQFSQIIK